MEMARSQSSFLRSSGRTPPGVANRLGLPKGPAARPWVRSKGVPSRWSRYSAWTSRTESFFSGFTKRGSSSL